MVGDAGSLYYVMPYVEGETLRNGHARGQAFTGETVRILKDVLDALVHAHRHGIVHRDIKPENIMLTGPPRSSRWISECQGAGRGQDSR